jgi:hypothetical protein
MPAPRHQPGDRVMIYEKPLTREKPEGMATLVELVSYEPEPDRETWLVRFDGEDPNTLYRRGICNKPDSPSLAGIGDPWPQHPRT